MADEHVAVAEPSPAATESAPGVLSQAVKAAWNKGEAAPEAKPEIVPPNTPPKPEGAAPSDAPKAAESEADAETGEAESAPATEPGKPQENLRKPKLSAEARIAQLTARIRTLENEASTRPAAAPNPTSKSAEPSPAPAPTRPKPTLDDKDADGKAKYSQAGDYEKYVEDVADWAAEQREVKLRAELKAEHAQAEQSRAISSKLAEAKGRYPDFDAVMPPTLNALMQDEAIPPVVKALVGESEVLPDLLYALGADAADWAETLELARTQPLKAMRKIALVESLVADELHQGKDQPKANGEAKKTPAAPPPPIAKPVTEVSGRNAAPADALETALEASGGKLTAAVKAEMNRRQLARMKAGG